MISKRGLQRQGVFTALFLLALATSLSAQVNLKNYVALIEANPYPETQEMFQSLAGTFSDSSPELANFFAAYARGGGFGTGWIYVTPDGENFIITNQHVVAQAGSVTIKFEQDDGTYLSYENAPIVYVDDFMDLAVVQFPDGARPFDEGFIVDTAFQPDGTELFSAGFPGFGGEPLWQFSTGIVTNARARPSAFTGYDYIIQHSAQIDPGNSGGPLMIRNRRSVTGFSVVGVNTWKANQRNNTNFSIPANEIPGLIERARASNQILASTERMERELERAAGILAAELASPNADTEQIDRYVSYALVGRRGWEAFQSILDIVAGDPEDSAFWEESFFADPIETMRTALYFQLWISTGDDAQRASTNFQEIVISDLDRIGELEEIRTRFTLGGRITEISWSWEYGSWRIRDFELPGPAGQTAGGGSRRDGQTADADVRDPEQEQAPVGGAGIFLGGRAAAGVSASTGAIYTEYIDFPENNSFFVDPIFNFDLGATLEILAFSPFWLETGASFTRRGRYYQIDTDADGSPVNDFWVQENIVYLSVPAIFKFPLELSPGFNFVVGAGPALNIAVSKSGRYWDWSDTELTLSDSWFDSDFPSTFAISLALRSALELGMGDRVVGFELAFDQHLTADYDYGVDETARLRSLNFGTYVKFPFVLE